MNVLKNVRTAIVAIAEADATLQTLTGQASGGFVRQFKDLRTAVLPAIALLVVTNTEQPGTGDRSEVLVQLTAVAEGNGAQTKAEDMITRLRDILTASAFAVRSLDAAVLRYTDRVDDAEAAAPTARGRADLDLVLQINTSPIS